MLLFIQHGKATSSMLLLFFLTPTSSSSPVMTFSFGQVVIPIFENLIYEESLPSYFEKLALEKCATNDDDLKRAARSVEIREVFDLVETNVLDNWI